MCVALRSTLRARAGLLSCLFALGLPLFAAMPALASSDYTEASLLKHPRIGDTQFDAWQEEIIGRHAQMSNNPDRWFGAAKSIACDMSEETMWKIALRHSIEVIQQAAGLPDGMTLSFENLRVTLIEGTCRRGRPEGPFIAVGEMDSVVMDEARHITERHRMRIEGTMRGGELEGELRSSGFWMEEGSKDRKWLHTVEVWEKGLKQTKWIEIAFSPPGEDVPPIITTISRPPSGPLRRATSEVVGWVGDMLYTENTFYIRWLNGWAIVHPVLMPWGEIAPPVRQRVCFQRDKETEEEWLCDPAYSFALKADGSNEASLQERFREKIAGLREADLQEAMAREARRSPSAAAPQASAEAAAPAGTDAKADADRAAEARRQRLYEIAIEAAREQQRERHKERDAMQAQIREFRFPDSNCGPLSWPRIDAMDYEIDDFNRRHREWMDCLLGATNRDYNAIGALVTRLGGTWSRNNDGRIRYDMPGPCECVPMIRNLIALANERTDKRADDVKSMSEQIRRFNEAQMDYDRRHDASRHYYYDPPPAFTPQTLPQPQPYVIPGYQ